MSKYSEIGLADEFLSLKWKSLGKEYDSFDFIPYGIGCEVTDNLNDTFHKMFVISPFLSKSIIEGFVSKRLINPDCTLITRKSELPKLNSEILTAFETYTVKDDVVDGEERISESGNSRTQDIHAKVYLRTKWSNSELYIGSANASKSAFCDGNVECLIALSGKQRYLNVEKMKTDLFGTDEKKNPFERVEPKDYASTADDSISQSLERAIREVCASRKVAKVSGEGDYTVTVMMKPLVTDAHMTLSPLMRADYKQVSETVVFSGVKLTDLSEWYVVAAEYDGQELHRVLKIRTEGIPLDARDSAVFSGIIKDKNSFLFIDERKLRSFKPFPINNARLERLSSIAFENNAENLLWVPPSIPYYAPRGVFKGRTYFSKTLVFSAWEMVPRMIACMLS